MVAAATSNWVPTQLGRYEVLGELATGGMAQILLARQGGPGGFERTVVIKRILPHLARDEAFVAMFTDEANTVSRIHHRNVVGVQELCRDDGELYLVMEYLEGESLFGIMRRLQRLERPLPYELSAYLMSEACEGLHGAHELRGPDGKLVNLVHRDVSPHNIFVTYDGGVKVIDFGIAKTDNRKNRTETGQLKGKFEYMSPEQCAAEPCDRRTDVYALGIVLYELITGRRLFKRKNELLTIKAVTEAPIIPPTVLRPDCPGQLEQIVMRALERDPKQRFQTCAAMHEELLLLLRQDKRLEAPPEVLMGRFMQELFADRIDEKKRMIEVIAKGSSPKSLPPPEVDLQYALPEIDDAALRSHTHMRKVAETRVSGGAAGAKAKGPRPDVGSDSQPGAGRGTGSGSRPAVARDAGSGSQPGAGRGTGSGSRPGATRDVGSDSHPGVARDASADSHPGLSRGTGSDSHPGLSRGAGSDSHPGLSRGTGSGSHPSAARVAGSAPRSAPQLERALPPPPPSPQAPPVVAARPAPLPPPVPASALLHADDTHSGQTQPGVPQRSPWGLWALLAGAAALIGVLAWIQLTPVSEAIQTTEVVRNEPGATRPAVTLSIDTQPPGAEVWVDGTALGPAPVSLAVDQSDVAVNYVARLRGYAETFGSVVPSRNEKLIVSLSPLPAAAPARAPALAPAPAPQPAAAKDSVSSRRPRSRGSRSYQPPPPPQSPQNPPAPSRQAPSGDPFKRFD
jgi:serine/threonine protein kinase